MKHINSHETSCVDDCRLISLVRHHHENGNLSVVESFNELPFEIKRVYYLYDIPGGQDRGGHSHYECESLIVAVSGNAALDCSDGVKERTVTLNRPYVGLLVCQGIWRRLSNFSSGSVCLVIASEEYDADDYVRSFEEFEKLTANKRIKSTNLE